MHANPSSHSPGSNGAPYWESYWPRFEALVERFRRLMATDAHDEAEALLEEIFALAVGRPALMRIYEQLVTALAVAVDALEGVADEL